MKKKRILKDWIQYILKGILFICFFVAGFDFEDMHTFNIVYYANLSIIIIDAIILYKYTNFFEE